MTWAIRCQKSPQMHASRFNVSSNAGMDCRCFTAASMFSIVGQIGTILVQPERILQAICLLLGAIVDVVRRKDDAGAR
jgi:hypothetical protein